jgi:hypothetical protein
MKDIYELLNDVDIDEDEMEIMEVSEFEKKKVKKDLKKLINKNRGWNKKGLAAAILCCTIMGGLGAIHIINPAYAQGIPIVGDIFKFLDNGRTGVYDKYKENANGIDVTKESNGVSITIKDAIFDGKTISYTYEIESNKDLGENPDISCAGLSVEDYDGGITGSSQVKRVSKNTYVGQDNFTIFDEKNEVNCELNIDNIRFNEKNDSSRTVISGQWDFNFNLKAIKNKKLIVNKSTEKEGVKAVIDSITKAPMSFTINYSQIVPKSVSDRWFSMSLDLEVKDDLGNIYENNGNGGHGDGKNMNWIETFGKLNEKASKLIITPKMNLSNNGGGVETDKNGKETEVKPTIDANHPEKGKVIFDNIVVELKR